MSFQYIYRFRIRGIRDTNTLSSGFTKCPMPNNTFLRSWNKTNLSRFQGWMSHWRCTRRHIQTYLFAVFPSGRYVNNHLFYSFIYLRFFRIEDFCLLYCVWDVYYPCVFISENVMCYKFKWFKLDFMAGSCNGEICEYLNWNLIIESVKHYLSTNMKTHFGYINSIGCCWFIHIIASFCKTKTNHSLFTARWVVKTPGSNQ